MGANKLGPARSREAVVDVDWPFTERIALTAAVVSSSLDMGFLTPILVG